MSEPEVVVVGLGAMGSAALYQLAQRGIRVLGLERFEPGHDRGSSHGATRVIRLSYFEHHSYVPLLRRAYELWHDLESAAQERLVTITGIIEVGPASGTLVSGTLASARLNDLKFDLLESGVASRRYPPFHLPPNFVAVVQPDGGYLAAEAAIQCQIALARKAGGEVRTGVTVTAIEPHPGGVRIVTSAETINAKTAIVAAGPWLKVLLPELAAPLKVTRQVLGWFEPEDPAQFARDRFPVFIIESEHGIHYGFPRYDDSGVKIAKLYHGTDPVDPDNVDRAVTPDDEAAIRVMLAEYLPAANGRLLAAKTCLYTETPDHDFIIDHLPGAPNVLIASPCSGHGFKFAPVVGEILADLATKGETGHDISRFALARFADES